MIEPHTDVVELVDYVPEELPETVLYSPNLDKSDSPIRARGTDFKTKNQLLGSNQQIKKEIENKLLSQSLESIELNHDSDNGQISYIFQACKKDYKIIITK